MDLQIDMHYKEHLLFFTACKCVGPDLSSSWMAKQHRDFVSKSRDNVDGSQ